MERRMKELKSKCERADEGFLLGEVASLKEELGRKEEEKEQAMQKAAAEFDKERTRLQRMMANAQVREMNVMTETIVMVVDDRR